MSIGVIAAHATSGAPLTYKDLVLADSPAYYCRCNAGALISAITASSSFGTEPASRAFDGSLTAAWTTNGTATGWLRAQLSAATVETAYAIRRRDDIPNRNPKTWTFEGSNDGSTWTTLDTQTNITWPTTGETKIFSFSNTTAYSYYRLNVSANNGDTYLSVAEMWLSTASGWDISGNGRPGTIIGSPTVGTTGLITGDTDTAITIPGSGHIAVPYESWQALSTFAVDAIIKPSSVASGTHVIASRQDGGGPWTFRLEGSALKFYYWNGGGTLQSAITAATTFVAGTKYHVGVGFAASGTCTIYVNGVADGSGSVGSLSTNAGNLRIGASGSGENFLGVVDEVAYYPSLSAARFAAHAAAA